VCNGTVTGYLVAVSRLVGPRNCFDTTDTTDTTISMLETKLSETLLDSFFFVYTEFGYGFLESVYANALATELEYRGVRVQRQVLFELHHRGKLVGRYRSDLLIENKILVEVKSTRQLVEADERQLLNYLKGTPIELGFLLHFGPKPKFVRRLLTNDRKRSGIATA
jgi:GxxExxY protein